MKCQKCGAEINSWETLCESCSELSSHAEQASKTDEISSADYNSQELEKQFADADESSDAFSSAQNNGNVDIAYLFYSAFIVTLPCLLIMPVVLGMIGVIPMPELFADALSGSFSAYLLFVAASVFSGMIFAIFTFKAKELEDRGELDKAASARVGPKFAAIAVFITLLLLCLIRVLTNLATLKL